MAETATIDLPADPHERFSDAAAESIVGREFDLDERIAGLTGLITRSLSADERGLWTRARVISARVVRSGAAIRVTVEGV